MTLDTEARLLAAVRECKAALELIRDGLRNLPASATAVQIDEIARTALARLGELGESD